jgi:threonine/homoserine/homoserine lactone efflux protein
MFLRRGALCHDDLMTSDLAAGVFAFTWLALAMTLVPGSDTVFVIRSSLRGGWFAGVVAALGVVTGVIVWGGLAGVGVALLLVRFPVAYTIVTIAGGLYLGYLAITTFVSARRLWRQGNEAEDDLGTTTANGTLLGTYSAGLLTNLLNPKIGVFYLSVMPGLFLGQNLTVGLGLGLATIHAGWGVIWLTLVSVLAGWARAHLLRPRPRAILEAVCGVFLLGFGVFVIVEVVLNVA